MEIILDSRENTLNKYILERDLDKYKDLIEIKTEQLELGDIHIKYNEIHLILERKTVNDLMASLKDGRYKEQKQRLLSNIIPSSRITYIIENDDIISSKNSKNQNILSGIYLHTLYRDNIHIIFTKNISETTTYLLLLATKIIDNPNNFNNIIKDDKTEYIENIKIKSKKIDNIDVNNCYLMQLSQIPNISIVIARNIASKYKTFRELIKALDEKESNEDKIKLLCEIDKIGHNKASKIIEYLQI